MRGSITAAAMFAVLLPLGLVHGAGSDPEPVKVEFKGHAGCPTEGDVLDEMLKQSKKLRAATGTEKAKVFKITVKQVGKRSVGELTYPTAGTPKKGFTGDTCQEVVSELAFAAALHVDPDAATIAAPPPSASASEPPPPAPTASVSAAPPPPAAPPPRGLRISVGAGVTLVALSNPGLVFAAPLHVDASFERQQVLSPGLRLSLVRQHGGLVMTDAGNAGFLWTVGQLDLCPVRLELTQGLTVRPCAGLEAGSLQSRGSAIAVPLHKARGWFAGRALARLSWWVVSPFMVDVSAGISLPFTRDEFVFNGVSSPAYKAPAAAPFAGLSLSARFP